MPIFFQENAAAELRSVIRSHLLQSSGTGLIVQNFTLLSSIAAKALLSAHASTKSHPVQSHAKVRAQNSARALEGEAAVSHRHNSVFIRKR